MRYKGSSMNAFTLLGTGLMILQISQTNIKVEQACQAGGLLDCNPTPWAQSKIVSPVELRHTHPPPYLLLLKYRGKILQHFWQSPSELRKWNGSFLKSLSDVEIMMIKSNYELNCRRCLSQKLFEFKNVEIKTRCQSFASTFDWRISRLIRL